MRSEFEERNDRPDKPKKADFSPEELEKLEAVRQDVLHGRRNESFATAQDAKRAIFVKMFLKDRMAEEFQCSDQERYPQALHIIELLLKRHAKKQVRLKKPLEKLPFPANSTSKKVNWRLQNLNEMIEKYYPGGVEKLRWDIGKHNQGKGWPFNMGGFGTFPNQEEDGDSK